MSPPPFRLALVGCGRLAEAGYLPAVEATAGVQLVAVADPDEERRALLAQLAADAAPVASFGDAATLLDACAVDGIVLASPAAAHVEDAATAAEHGIPTLVEKPPAPDAEGARRLAALDPPPWVAFNRRFDPAVQAVRAALPAEVELDLELRIQYRRRSWGAVAVADDALGDLGPHLVDWARWLSAKEVVRVVHARLADDRAEVHLEMDGARATLHAEADRIHQEAIVVRNAAGSVLAEHHVGGVVGAVTGRLRRGPHPLVASLAAQLSAFVDAARGGPPGLLADADDGVAAMLVLDAARSCAEHAGAPTSVPPVPER